MPSEPVRTPMTLRGQIAKITCIGCERRYKKIPFKDGSGFMHQPLAYASTEDFCCDDASNEIIPLVDAAVQQAREPGPCGKHPRAYWVEPCDGKAWQDSEGCANVKGHEGKCDWAGPFRNKQEGFCTVCAELAVKDANYRAMADSEYELRQQVIVLRQQLEGLHTLAGIWHAVSRTVDSASRQETLLGCADELEAALTSASQPKGKEPGK